MQRKSRQLCWVLELCGVLAIAPLGAYANQPDANADGPPLDNQLKGVRLDQNLDAPLPLDAVFRDEHGAEVHLGDYFDGKRPVILTLVYFKCPMLCTLVLNDTLRSIRAMSGLQLGDDFQIVTVSFNPREGPELAAEKKGHYVTEYCRGLHHDRAKVEASWHFLTGEEASIRKLTEAAGFHYRWDVKFQQYAHPSGIIVVTPDGKIARYFFGIGYEPNDLRLTLVEASKNKIGGLVDQFLLGCFHYDPTRGKYSLSILNALKLGGVLILVVMGGMLGVMSRHNRRKRAALAAAGASSYEDSDF
ncbi:MAG TPA: SCO family protein [Phycisphaerae bacterium]|nr:SCO family protein [Phycisphaerales bacterium]HRX85572.1 SCO family protein [Phycisphaerae bacterium]